MLKDAPQSFHGYNPENFDGDFVGPIKAGEALARSRNVPAVALAAQLTRPTFYEFLKRGGVALPGDENYYGTLAAARRRGSYDGGNRAPLCNARERWPAARVASNPARMLILNRARGCSVRKRLFSRSK
jgi:hypothetical protein